jgi:hypothetical protein
MLGLHGPAATSGVARRVSALAAPRVFRPCDGGVPGRPAAGSDRDRTHGNRRHSTAYGHGTRLAALYCLPPPVAEPILRRQAPANECRGRSNPSRASANYVRKTNTKPTR